jgi:putative membrane protein
MELIAKFLVGLVALEHIYIFIMEMFLWETLGKKAFKGVLPNEMFPATKTLAANLGLYNGFLATGLLWTFFITDNIWKVNISTFFLGCVIIAGIFGAVTASKKIFFTQALPAIMALVFVLLAR